MTTTATGGRTAEGQPQSALRTATTPTGTAAGSGAHAVPGPSGGPAAGTAATTTETARRLGRTPGSRFHPDQGTPRHGAAAAAKAVADDLQQLVRAEIAYAKSEVEKGAKAKGLGVGLLVGAGVVAWLGIQGLLITAGFALAAAGLPGWAAAGIVTLVLLLVAAGAGLVAKRKLARPLSLDPAKERIEEDVTWIKTHLPGQ